MNMSTRSSPHRALRSASVLTIFLPLLGRTVLTFGGTEPQHFAAFNVAAAAAPAEPVPPAAGRAPGDSVPAAAGRAAGDTAAGATPLTDKAKPSAPFTPLDLPDWVVLHTNAPAKDAPWILIVDDPQCPYCMQLLLAIEKEREMGDPAISQAILATLPYPLPYHDQSAHIVADAYCLEASRSAGRWSAASYLDWLIVEPWKSEPAWKTTTIDDLEKDGGFFDTKYESHKVLSSRRREFQTGFAKSESACTPETCRGDADCEKLCADVQTCRASCAGDRASVDSKPPAESAAGQAPSKDKCLADCASTFASRRYRQYSKVHSTCLLDAGPASAHAKVAASFAWAVGHKVPGTPTVYAGHPSIGFRTLGDSDHLVQAIDLLKSALADARAALAGRAAPRGTALLGEAVGKGSAPGSPRQALADWRVPADSEGR